MAQHHLIIADCVEVKHAVVVGGKAIYIVNHAAIPAQTQVTVALADTVFTSMKSLWTSHLAPLCPATTGYSGVVLRDLRSEGMPEVSSSAAGVTGSDATGDALPRQIASCLTFRTNRAGRKYRGRAYWGGYSETANGTNGHMSAAAKAAIDAFAAGYRTASNVGGLSLVVAHRPTAFDEATGLPISPGLGFMTDVTQVLCRDDIWDNQRRRAG